MITIDRAKILLCQMYLPQFDEEEKQALNKAIEALEELETIKKWKDDIMESFCKYDVSSFEELINNSRNKAIDEFAERIMYYCSMSHMNATMIRQLAEQMKVDTE